MTQLTNKKADIAFGQALSGLILVILALMSFHSAWTTYFAPSWQKAQARVLSVAVAERTFTTSAPSKFGSGGSEVKYVMTISYEYFVSRHRKVGYYGDIFPTRQIAEHVRDQMPVGTVRKVFYNPLNPDESTLYYSEIDSENVFWVLILLGCSFSLIGVCLLLTGFSPKYRKFMGMTGLEV